MILLNDFKRQWADTRDDTLAAVDAVGQSGWYILGEEVRQFEAALADYWGVRHAIGVASGLDALEISLRALGCGPGDKVLTPPITAFATTLAIVRTGATPVFGYEARGGTRFHVPVHLYGHPLTLDPNPNMVEDCAQSVGAHRGISGALAATSFYPTKNLGAIGDGGAILTNDDGLAARARCLRDYGQTAKYQHAEIGFNSRLDELHAAILRRAHLPRLDGWTAARRRVADAYLQGITNQAIRIPARPRESVWHLFPVLVDPARKRDFMDYLRARNIVTGEHYPLPVFDQPALRGVPCETACDAEQARTFCASEVSLPIHPYLTEEEIAVVIAACNDWQG